MNSQAELRGRRRAAFAALGTTLLLFFGVAVTPASALVYWPAIDNAGGGIGRASLDGSNADHGFLRTGAPPIALAVNSSHIYWLAVDNFLSGEGHIGRARLDGTTVQHRIIEVDGGLFFGGLAVNESHVYWTSQERRTPDFDPLGDNRNSVPSIGRANLDGSNANPGFIHDTQDGGSIPAWEAHHLAVDSKHVYWTLQNGYGGVIGRANLDGSDADRYFVIVDFAPGPDGLAVNDSHIYFSGPGINRVNLDGSGMQTEIVPGAADWYPNGLALNSSHLFWASYYEEGRNEDTIMRSNLDGTGVEKNFIRRTFQPRAVAIDSTPNAPPPPPGSGGGTGGDGTESAPDPAKACRTEKPTIRGSKKNDMIDGTPGRDIIFSYDGHDIVNGLEGNDILCLGPGNDQARGGDGNDALNGSKKHDRLKGDAGNDNVFGSSGRDRVSGAAGDDVVNGGPGDGDKCSGGPGTDKSRRGCENITSVP
jgi:hypothetical protein